MKFIKTKQGYLISRSAYFGNPVFIKAETAEEIDSDNAYRLLRTIYGANAVNLLEKKFKEVGIPIEENEIVKSIFVKICTSLDERIDFDQEIANMEWEISMAVHRG